MDGSVDLKLDDKQIEAIRACSDNARRVVAVTGKAGTGKTTIIRHVYNILSDAGYRVALAAPTGKAAKRIKEATDVPASTFHRLLEYSSPGERDPVTGKTYGMSMPKRGRENPLDFDAVIGDEYAMVNVDLHASITASIPRGGRLLTFGDVNQLPPIESMAVHANAPSKFQELLRKFDGITLETIHRTGAGSGIADNGARILRGFAPMRRDDFAISYTDQPLDVLSKVIRETDINYATIENQIITPSNITWVGQHRLNALLQTHFRPERDGWYELERHKWHEKFPCRIRVGDKVIINENLYNITANDGTLGVYNGETGIVTEITDFGEIEINLGDRIVVIPPEIEVLIYGKTATKRPQRDISLAYALTTHKCQGSEYQHIIYMMNKSIIKWLNRYNFYTGITRARLSAHVITDMRSMSVAVSNTRTTFA